MSQPYKLIVGLEIHVELNTATKMFCRCKNDPFGTEPNTNTCPVCLGLPGTLPVPNREAVRKSILVGKALGSEIAKLSKWDRKHYFYPDLPKGFQISQYDMPICIGGQIDLLDATGKVESTIRFERVHMEDDAGKLQHVGNGVTHVDLNRAGVPLIEVVSKPDITSAEQARRFLQELQLLVRTLGVSSADMEKGQMRCDVNINIAFEHEGKTVKTPITEVKNVNSSRAVERSIQIEAQRQFDEWMAAGPIRERKNKLTAGWNEDTETVTVQRHKEEANDYRYFPEPDIPPIRVYEDSDLNPEKVVLPELPNARRIRYIGLGLAMPDIEVLMSDPERLAKFEEYVGAGIDGKEAAKWLVNVPGTGALSPENLRDMLDILVSGEASFSAVKPFVPELATELQSGKKLRDILSERSLLQLHDPAVVQLAVEQVLAENPKAVADYKSGNERIIGFIVGQVMKKAAGKAQPAKVQEAIKEALAN